MDSPVRNGKQHDASAVDGDSFEHGENFPKDEQNLTEGEEDDLEATVKANQDRAEIDASVLMRPCPTSCAQQQLSVLDFLRNFLFERGMTKTLECLEAECAELVEKGEMDEKLIDLVPKVYIEIQRLDRELKSARREKEEYRRAASAAAEPLQRAQRARDAHRLQHQRVVQEKNRLLGEIKKLKLQCDSNQSEVKRMSEKYQTISKRVLQVALESDKALQGANQGTLQDASLSQTIKEKKCSFK